MTCNPGFRGHETRGKLTVSRGNREVPDAVAAE
jgi:hypothetical protein